MTPPAFWYRPADQPGAMARALAPLAAVYAAGTALRLARGRRAGVGVPVIAVGNINAGGSGKTPLVMALVQRLAAAGVAAHVVSRGYGGRLSGPVRVDPACHSDADAGDEPLLLAASGPVWVARDRAAGARAAVAAGAQAIVLDDGLQNPALAHDLTIIAVDARRGFGNGRVLPAGPLREPVATAMARGDLVIPIGGPSDQAVFDSRFAHLVTLPQLAAELVVLATGIDWPGLPVMAFAGIGHPDKFFDTLRGTGAQVRGTVALTDHQPLTGPMLQRLARQAQDLGAQLVTTEKDAVRLPRAWQGQVLTLPVRLIPEDWSPIDAALARIGLAPSHTGGSPGGGSPDQDGSAGSRARPSP